MVDTRVIETQEIAIPELHDRNTGQGLCNRPPVVDGFCVDLTLRLTVRHTVYRAAYNLAGLDEHQAPASHMSLLQSLSE